MGGGRLRPVSGRAGPRRSLPRPKRRAGGRKDRGRDLFLRRGAVEDAEARREFAGKREEARAHPHLQIEAEILEALLLALPALGAGKALLWRQVDEEGQVRLAPDHQRVQLVDETAQVAAAEALIHPRGIGEAVADHDPARGERGRDGAFEMVAARGGEQQDLGLGRPAVRVALEHETADLLGAGRAAGLARQHDVMALGRQRLGQKPRLRGFPRSVDAFEGDEHPASAVCARGGLEGAGRKPADRRFHPHEKAALGDIGGGDKRHRRRLVEARDVDDELAERVARLHRRLHRAVEHRLGGHALLGARGQQQRHVLGGRKAHLRRGTEPDRRLGKLRALCGNGVQHELPEGPVRHRLRLLCALGLRRHAGEHEDDAPLAHHRRADKAEARLFGMAGLQPVGVPVGRGDLQQRVAVMRIRRGSILVIVGRLGKERVIFREIGDDMRGQHAEIVHRHALARVRPARGIGEGRAGHAERLGAFGHQPREGLFRAGEPFGHHDAGVIARVDRDALHQLAYRGAVELVEEHRRPAHLLRPGRDGEGGVRCHPAVAQRVEQQLERHQLRHRGGRQRDVGVLLEQHRAGRHVIDPGGMGTGFEGACGKGCKQREAQDGNEAEKRHRDGTSLFRDGIGVGVAEALDLLQQRIALARPRGRAGDNAPEGLALALFGAHGGGRARLLDLRGGALGIRLDREDTDLHIDLAGRGLGGRGGGFRRRGGSCARGGFRRGRDGLGARLLRRRPFVGKRLRRDRLGGGDHRVGDDRRGAPVGRGLLAAQRHHRKPGGRTGEHAERRRRVRGDLQLRAGVVALAPEQRTDDELAVRGVADDHPLGVLHRRVGDPDAAKRGPAVPQAFLLDREGLRRLDVALDQPGGGGGGHVDSGAVRGGLRGGLQEAEGLGALLAAGEHERSPQHQTKSHARVFAPHPVAHLAPLRAGCPRVGCGPFGPCPIGAAPRAVAPTVAFRALQGKHPGACGAEIGGEWLSESREAR
ncbi:hypothetical protein SDC9_41028 [bioreactor metagenome]|uniref:Uncharacterized protein n=1 Tax=bioreactor metagenome TaxID=1076179 RepID=A0A644VTZ4_9ZZZZ